MQITSFRELKLYIASDAYRYTGGNDSSLKLYFLNIGFNILFGLGYAYILGVHVSYFPCG